MTPRTRTRFPWYVALLALAGVLAACEQDEPTPEALCKRAAGCEAMDVLVSGESCMQQVRSRLRDTPPACSECVLGLPCSGLARVASGKVSLTQICPACPSSIAKQPDCNAEHALICGIGLRPPPAPSGSASAAASATASATPSATASATASASPGGSAAPKASAAPALAPIPAVEKLPTAPVPPFPP